MRYCSKCGNKVKENDKFCIKCGCKNENDEHEKVEFQEETIEENEFVERKTVYEGKIHKCPNCGEVIKSFIVNCPSCGYEFRDGKSANSVREFALKLEKIELGRVRKKLIENISKTDEQKINLIRSFVIPNNKEDIYEFMILASSNINFNVYGMGDKGVINDSQRAVSEAWVAKMEQAYQKAEITFGDDTDFIEIKSLYEKTMKKLERKKKEIVKYFIWFGIGLAIFSIIILIIPSTPQDEARHNHLEYVVEQIEDDIIAGKFDEARNKAYTLTYDEELDKERHEYWENKRENILKQIDAASGTKKEENILQEEQVNE